MLKCSDQIWELGKTEEYRNVARTVGMVLKRQLYLRSCYCEVKQKFVGAEKFLHTEWKNKAVRKLMNISLINCILMEGFAFL